MNKHSLPEGWSLKKLGEIATVVSGGTPSRSQPKYWANGNIPWVTPTDITRDNSLTLLDTKEKITELGLRSSSANLLPSGTLLMTSRATVGEIKISTIPVSTNQGFKNLIPNALVDKWYLYYQMLFHKESYKQLGNGSTFLEVSKSATESFEIYYAPLPEQRAIADILSMVDEAIAKSESLVRKYQSIKQGLMFDLLTRGVDENGELRASYEEAPELYRETSLGWLPKDWEVLKIRDARKSITSGSRWWARYYANEGALFLRIGNLTREHINLRFDSIQRVRVPNDAESKRTVVAAGDVLISVTADLGIIGVIPKNFEEAYVNQHIALVKVDAEITNPRWLGHFMASRLGWYQFQTLNDSGAKAGLNLPTVDSLSFANPPREERNRIVKMIDNQDDMIKVEKELVT